MRDNKLPKLLVSEAEASEKIRSRIDIGKELLETEISSEQELANLKHETDRWTDYNKTLFLTLFDESPLSEWYGLRLGWESIQWVHETKEYKGFIAVWIDNLEIVYGKLELYEELTNNTQQTIKNDAVSNENKKIFIGHGGSDIWLRLKNFIVDRLELEYEEFNRISAAGKPTSDRLKEMLEVCCMAFLIMTGEDEQADGALRARENVVHEVGLFQGRLGFENAIILLEEGCGDFSNIHGITYIPFPKGNIRAAFEDIREVLERESII